MAQQNLSSVSEDYLKAIYELQSQHGEATNSLLAERLGVSPTSISSMLQSLADKNLITHEPYQGTYLTEAGSIQALKLIRRHRLIETFLAQQLGLSWDEVHQEAERLEHAISETLESRIDATLGYPETDPHGAPIPRPDGTLSPVSRCCLTDLHIGQSATIAEVSDHDAGLLRYLGGLGLYPQVGIEVLAIEPYGGPLTLHTGGSRQQMLGIQAAAFILVENVKEITTQ